MNEQSEDQILRRMVADVQQLSDDHDAYREFAEHMKQTLPLLLQEVEDSAGLMQQLVDMLNAFKAMRDEVERLLLADRQHAALLVIRTLNDRYWPDREEASHE